MLFPQSHAWTPWQKGLLAIGCVITLAGIGAGIYAYERYCRSPSDSILVGTWKWPGVDDVPVCYRFQSDHTVQITACNDSGPIVSGRWFAGGRNIYLSFTGEDAEFLHEKRPEILHIVDIQPDALYLRRWFDEPVRTYQRVAIAASNQTMQPTASPRTASVSDD
jgi:hypothetical protein